MFIEDIAYITSFLSVLEEKGEEMEWKKEYLDVILVPIGLFIMLAYHLCLFYRYLKHPQTTLLGYENHCRRAWVERTLQNERQKRSISVSVLSSTVKASHSLASISLALSSLIAAWVGSTSTEIFSSPFIYGGTGPTIISIKYISLLICFIGAFAFFVQCVQCLVHSNFLITMPNCEVSVSYVEKEVIRGNVFWCLGLRAIYFAITLLMWIFGPIPMFLSSVVMVIGLYFFDTNSTPLQAFQSANDVACRDNSGVYK